MAIGLKCWDASGNLTMDTGSRMGRIIGEVLTTQNQAGSLQVPAFAQGTGFFCLLPLTQEGYTGSGGSQVRGTIRPNVSIDQSTQTLSWGQGTQCRIAYGVY